MRSSPFFLRFLLPLVPFFIAPALRAEPVETTPRTDVVDHAVKVPEKFMRFVDDGHSGGKFETAVVTFKNKDGVTLRLVGAIHIGEKAYYEALNKSFENDDAVLFEMVSPKAGTGIPKPGQKSDNPINQMQHIMKDVLNLDFQLDDIDYTKPNFIHADMDAETFTKMQEERGETFQALMIKQIMKAFSGGDDKGKGDQPMDTEKLINTAIETFTRPDMERRVKVIVAKQLDQMEDSAMGLDNPNGSVIVTERNKVAMKVVENTVASGKKKISVFYGAAHMPDMTKRVEEMGFTPVSVTWNTAWDLTLRADAPSGAEKLLKELFKALDDN